jgi:uncharacterized membrane protein
MTWLRFIVSELIALFVDDGLFAAALIIWVALIAFLLPQIGVSAGVWRGAALFAGFAAILIESVTRRSKAP